MGLSKKHHEFINQFFLCNMNQTDAYQAVYPKSTRESARREGSRLLTNVDISEEIKLRLAEKALSSDEVLLRLAAVARGSLADFADVRQLSDLADHPLAYLVRKIKTTAKKAANGAVTITSELELYSSLEALQLLGKYHQLFSDAPTVSVFTHPVWHTIADELGQTDDAPAETEPGENGYHYLNGKGH